VKLSNGKQLNTGHPASLEQQAKEKMQHMAINGNIPAAQQLGTEQYQQGTLANQKATQEAQNKNTEWNQTNAVQELAQHSARLTKMAADKDPAIAEQGRQGLAQIAALVPTTLIPKTRKEKDIVGNTIEETELVNPYSGIAPNPKPNKAPVGTDGKPVLEGDTGTINGKRIKMIHGQPVPI
jgi:hypothetical protein